MSGTQPQFISCVAAHGGRRARLLAGAAVLLLAPLAAHQASAQTASPKDVTDGAIIANRVVEPRVEDPSRPLRPNAEAGVNGPVTGSDGLTEGAVYIDAAEAGRTGDVVQAQGGPDNGEQDGRLTARFRDHTLRADQMTYDTRQGVATAQGRAEITAPDGSVVHASQIELDSDLKAGVAVDFATRFSNGASLMAATAVRRSEAISELNRVIFTPCPICDDQGQPKEPSISIQADKVVQDADLRAVLYRNAVFRLGGVPVFYMPFFSHPDPTVERASGFLIPRLNWDRGRGVSYEQPYLHVVSPSEDWLFTPQINSEVAPFLNAQWRRRFNAGMIIVRGGYTHERNFGDFDLNNDGTVDRNVKFGPRENRSYLLAHGRFDPEGPWRWGFTAERTSDKTLFDRYDVQGPYQDNGLYYGDRRRLISQIYAERQTARSYVSVAAFTIQSLRVAEFDPITPALNIFEDEKTLPVVAPLIDARWEPEGAILGGRLRLRGSAVSLTREKYVSAVLHPDILPDLTGTGLTEDDLPGVDSRRVTGAFEWRRSLITPSGVRWEPFVDGRVDFYAVDDLPPMMGVDDTSLTRHRVTAGLDVSYPLIRRLSADSDLILEPMVQASISNAADLDRRIPIEESQTMELDHISLFRTDRFPGFDLYEGGFRFTAGGRATINWSEGRSASLFIGRSMRGDDETRFKVHLPDDPTRRYDPSGLASQTSDWVVHATFSPSDRIRGWGHATIDGSGDIRRAEATVDGRWGRRNIASVSYIIDRSNPLQGPLNRNYEFIQLTGQQFIYGHWGVTVAGIADIERDLITRSEVGVVFDDDCLRIEVGWRRDNTRARPTGPSEGVFFRLNLATFGGSGYDRIERR